MTLAFTEYGEGPPIIVLHGVFGSGRNWAGIAKHLSSDHRIITVDMPNHGDSPWADDVTYELMAIAVNEFMTLHELHGATALAHSMGGKAAMTLALTNPESINRLIVVDISPVTYDHSSLDTIEAMEAIDLNTVKTRRDAHVQLSEIVKDGPLRDFLLQNLRKEGDRYVWRINLPALKNGLDALHGFPNFDPHIHYGGPAMFIDGADSNFIRAEYHDEIRRLFPRAEIIEIPDAGHWVHADQPDKLLGHLKRFLAEN